MEYDLKTMYIVRGKLILAAFDLSELGEDRETIKILTKAIFIIEKRIFDKEFLDNIERYTNLLNG